MADPISPHLLGITLDSNGVANTQVVAINLTTGEMQTQSTNASKLVVFDAANFTSAYSNGDIIAFENVGASIGGTTITITNPGGFQEATITCAAAPTGAINL